MGFHQQLIFLAALRHRAHCKVVDNAEVFEPGRNELAKALGVMPDLTIEASAFTLSSQDGGHRVFTHLPNAGRRIA